MARTPEKSGAHVVFFFGGRDVYIFNPWSFDQMSEKYNQYNCNEFMIIVTIESSPST